MAGFDVGTSGKTRTTGLMRWLTEHRYGGPTRSAETQDTVTTTPTRIVFPRPDRVAIFVTNTGTVDAFLALGAGNGAGVGFRVAANGGFWAVWQDDDDTLPTETWYGSTLSSTALLYIVETISDTILAPEEK